VRVSTGRVLCSPCEVDAGTARSGTNPDERLALKGDPSQLRGNALRDQSEATGTMKLLRDPNIGTGR
jgi:hypothetical protein